MELMSAIKQLSRAAQQGTGASSGAATVLLFGWNSAHPIRGLTSLDTRNRTAALTVIEAALTHRLNGGILIEDTVGYPMIHSFAMRYGVDGSFWEA